MPCRRRRPVCAVGIAQLSRSAATIIATIIATTIATIVAAAYDSATTLDENTPIFRSRMTGRMKEKALAKFHGHDHAPFSWDRVFRQLSVKDLGARLTLIAKTTTSENSNNRKEIKRARASFNQHGIVADVFLVPVGFDCRSSCAQLDVLHLVLQNDMRLQQGLPQKNRHELKPKTNFLALSTSSTTMPRPMRPPCSLVLALLPSFIVVVSRPGPAV